jgi:hypothetical protein
LLRRRMRGCLGDLGVEPLKARKAGQRRSLWSSIRFCRSLL